MGKPIFTYRLPPTELTPREQEVYDLLAANLTHREVAAELGLAVGTVERHREAICIKLGLSGWKAIQKHAARER